jgi:hypothetical protein
LLGRGAGGSCRPGNSAGSQPLQFGRIQYDSPGSDTRSNTSLNAEYVVIKTRGTTGRSLTGWTVREAANHVYKFGTFTLGAGKQYKATLRKVPYGPTGEQDV